MNVRVLREGVMQKDYHTAQNVAKAAGGTKETELSTRWYLADADFLVGLGKRRFPAFGKSAKCLEKTEMAVVFRSQIVCAVRAGLFCREMVCKTGKVNTVLRRF